MINNWSAHTTDFFHPFWLTCACFSKSVTPLILEYLARKEIVASIKAPATLPMFAIFASRQLLRRDDREKAAAPPGPESESGGWMTENSRFEDHTWLDWVLLRFRCCYFSSILLPASLRHSKTKKYQFQWKCQLGQLWRGQRGVGRRRARGDRGHQRGGGGDEMQIDSYVLSWLHARGARRVLCNLCETVSWVMGRCSPSQRKLNPLFRW